MAKKDSPPDVAALQTSAPSATAPDAAPLVPHAHDFHAVEVGKIGIACRGCGAKLGESDRAPIEARAEERGHVDPQRVVVYDNKGRPVGEQRPSIADHRAWICKCAMVHSGSAIGREVTIAEYDALVSAAMNLEIRNGPRPAA